MSRRKPVEERVHPDLKEAFSNMPVLDLVSDVQKTRNMHKEMFKNMPVDPGIPITSMTVHGRDGTTKIPVRIYTPQKKNDKLLPGLLYIHGGGYILGFAAMSDSTCQMIARETQCIVVSADYRLAPDFPFPAGLNDCYAVLEWMASSQNGLGIDPDNIAVIGGSAGGGLAAAVALMARDKGAPSLKFQMPLFPMIDDRNITPSSYEITDGRFWNRDTNIKAWKMYLGDITSNVSIYAAPSRAENLTGLPPTFTCVGELDLFRDEAIDFAARLLQAGVSTEFHIYPGCFHGFENFVPNADISKRANADILLYIKNSFGS